MLKFLVGLLFVGVGLAMNEDFVKKLDLSSSKTELALKAILKEWDVKDYPNFLKSCFMHKSSWEIMKYKLMQRVLTASVSKTRKNFVASFLGSSVTAGHDSNFNFSTPVVLGNLMKAPFADVDIDFVSRNVALGNNPCMPYDICVKYFAGFDADIVHWEQNYFCDGNPIMEQFIRQAMTIPTKPIVVFSEAQTGHWDGDKCIAGPHKVTPEEMLLLTSDPQKLVTELNRDEFHRAWGFVSSIDKNYHGAAIQTFQHLKHDAYACLGPYIKDWMKGAASWHPSVIGHRLRASHHAYFWLLIWHDALKEVSSLAVHRSVDAILKDVDHHLSTLYPPIHAPVHKSLMVDDMKCYTDYEPRSVREVSLKDRVVAGLARDESDVSGWHFIIYENLVDKKLVENSQRNGYLDFKKLMFGNAASGPLSLHLSVVKEGPVLLCETPGIWGKLPNGFVHFYESKAEVFITTGVSDMLTFHFNKDTAKKLEVSHTKDLDICSLLKLDGKDAGVPLGEHVLTIVPKVEEKIILAWLLTP